MDVAGQVGDLLDRGHQEIQVFVLIRFLWTGELPFPLTRPLFHV